MDNTLQKTLEIELNKASAENGSDTPDFVLAKYLIACLKAFDVAVKSRDSWRSEHASDTFAR